MVVEERSLVFSVFRRDNGKGCFFCSKDKGNFQKKNDVKQYFNVVHMVYVYNSMFTNFTVLSLTNVRFFMSNRYLKTFWKSVFDRNVLLT